MARTYSLSEAIQMLEKNHKLEFKQHTDVDGVVFLKLNDRGCLVSRSAHGDKMIIGIEGKWELVQKPVTFMEAAQAYCDGKTIYCEYLGRTYDYKPNRDNGFVAFHKIMNADWYIKEDEDV